MHLHELHLDFLFLGMLLDRGVLPFQLVGVAVLESGVQHIELLILQVFKTVLKSEHSHRQSSGMTGNLLSLRPDVITDVITRDIVLFILTP